MRAAGPRTTNNTAGNPIAPMTAIVKTMPRRRLPDLKIDKLPRKSTNDRKERIVTRPRIESPRVLVSAAKKVDMYPGLTIDKNTKRNRGMTATTIENHLSLSRVPELAADGEPWVSVSILISSARALSANRVLSRGRPTAAGCRRSCVVCRAKSCVVCRAKSCVLSPGSPSLPAWHVLRRSGPRRGGRWHNLVTFHGCSEGSPGTSVCWSEPKPLRSPRLPRRGEPRLCVRVGFPNQAYQPDRWPDEPHEEKRSTCSPSTQ